MYDRPRDLAESTLMSVVAREYGLSIAASEYLPVGYGAYHWKVVTDNGATYFVTVDDLHTKSWFGPSAESTFVGLSNAYAVARGLAEQGLTCVVATSPTHAGSVVCRLSDSYALSLTDFVDGTTLGFGAQVDGDLAVQLQRVLVQLHGTEAPGGIRIEWPNDVVVEVRNGLQVNKPGPAGRYTSRLVGWLADNHVQLERAVRRLAVLAAARDQMDLVVTHGEPHWGNIIVTTEGLRLVDWDTVALARPERDLWHISRDPGELSEYEQLAAPVHGDALEFYAMAWTLRDVVACVQYFTRPHEDDAESANAWDNLTSLTLNR